MSRSSRELELQNPIAALTDVGQKRRLNQDVALATLLADDVVLLLVADGVGGGNSGEVASSGAVDIVTRHLGSASLADPAGAFVEAFSLANRELWDRAQHDAKLAGMATTLVAAIVRDGRAWIANVGDSRAYLVAKETITRISLDHSLVAESAHKDHITEEDAKEAGVPNVVTRSIASRPSVEVDMFGPFTLAAGDRLLLCSDGLHGVLSDLQIRVIAERAPPAQAVIDLTDAANANGGPDNISAALYRQPDPAEFAAAFGAAAPPKREPRRLALVGAGGGAALVAAVIVGFFTLCGGSGGGLGGLCPSTAAEQTAAAGQETLAAGAGEETVAAGATETPCPTATTTATATVTAVATVATELPTNVTPEPSTAGTTAEVDTLRPLVGAI